MKGNVENSAAELKSPGTWYGKRREPQEALPGWKGSSAEKISLQRKSILRVWWSIRLITGDFEH